LKVVILAGGRGTRISEESHLRPKPMVEIGEKPILWHIMKIYAAHGFTDFIICLGYRGYVIKEYFANYRLHSAERVTFDYGSGALTYEGATEDPWRVTLVETGLDTQTGGRLRRILPLVREEEAFCMTYGDGLSNVDVRAAVERHRTSKMLATVTTVAPAGRFGVVKTDGIRVTDFSEKPGGDGTLINGGYFVLSPKALDRITDDHCVWEKEPLQSLATEGQLSSYHHTGFWQPMDTLRERDLLAAMWDKGEAPWKVW
jgi:glucose-1-phosphate cytidylyltransferase